MARSPLLKPEDAAALLGVSTKHLLYLSKNGAIAFVNIGLGKRPTRRYRIEDIEEFIAERRAVSPPSMLISSSRNVATTAVYEVIDFKKTLDQLRADRSAAKTRRAKSSK
jgi:hypothetical protein